MTILGVEFSSAQRSVALHHQGALAEAMEVGGRNTAALGMIEQVLAEMASARGDIEALAIGLGPGSYTGIRSAIALAQGWELANGAKLLGISSIEAIVARAQEDKITGRVTVLVDAQRNEFYLATYDLTAAGWAEVEPLQIVSLADAQNRSDAGHLVVGPEVTRWFPAGRIIFPTAATLVRLAGQRTNFVTGDQLEPIYLRETTFVKAPPSRIILPPDPI